MAVFVAASDESYSQGCHRNNFLYGGFLAPVTEWYGRFADDWDRNVLAGPPRIPYLHMVEIRSPKWCQENGISRTQGDQRVRAAFELISEMPSLTPISIEFNAGHLLDTITKRVLVQSAGGQIAGKTFVPDYLAFVAYAYLVLEFCNRTRPDAQKVDFLVEKNGEITNHIQQFYRDMRPGLESIGMAHLIPLLGDLIPGDKDRAPLQAADVLCWYSQNAREGVLDDKNSRRYQVIASREGVREQLTDSNVVQLWEAITGD